LAALESDPDHLNQCLLNSSARANEMALEAQLRVAEAAAAQMYSVMLGTASSRSVSSQREARCTASIVVSYLAEGQRHGGPYSGFHTAVF
jgi:hypothetical protein